MFRFLTMYILFVLFVFATLANNVCYGESSQKDFQQINVGDYIIWGCLDKPCSIDPGQIGMFVFRTTDNITEYGYKGRTGEKTFTIERSETDTLSKPRKEKKEIYSVYFTPNDYLYLFHTIPFKEQGCRENDNIYLKMFRLSGNQLTFQIILPDCMKKTR